MLAKLTELKFMLDGLADDQDERLTLCLQWAADVTRQLARVTSILRTEATIYPYDAACRASGTLYMRLSHGPIESITSIKQRWYQGDAWADVTAYVEDTDYIIDRESAIVEAIDAPWDLHRRQLVQVIGVFGYYDPNDDAPNADAIAPPPALQQGNLEQAQWFWKRRALIGTKGITLGQGGAVNLQEIEIVESLKNAVAALPFRRII